MIGKLVKGKDFRGCLDYVLGKDNASIIGGNMASTTPSELATEFAQTRGKNSRVKKPVLHTSLSVKPEEKISNDKWCAIASDYLNNMGFDNNQHVVVQHKDTEHNHIHIIASRVKWDGCCVKDSWDFLKSAKVIKELEKKYDLIPTPEKENKLRRSPTTGETRLTRRTGEESVREYLQEAIAQLCEQPLTMSELAKKLKDQDIETHLTKRGNQLGISFKAKGIAFSGTDLGRGYTFPGLIKHMGVRYDEERDLQRSNSGEISLCIVSPKLPPLDLDRAIALRQFEISERLKKEQEKEKDKKNKSDLAL